MGDVQVQSVVMYLALVALSLAQAVGLPTAEEIKRRIVACGVSPDRIRMEVDYGGEDVARMLRGASPTPQVYRCLAQSSLDMSVIFEFYDPSEPRSFIKAYGSIARAQDERDARNWLRERGLLARLPLYVPTHESAGHFARRLERFCGIKPGTYLRPLGRDTISIIFQDPRRPSITDDQFNCVLNAATVSKLRLGFIGNEAYSQLPKTLRQK